MRNVTHKEGVIVTKPDIGFNAAAAVMQRSEERAFAPVVVMRMTGDWIYIGTLYCS